MTLLEHHEAYKDSLDQWTLVESNDSFGLRLELWESKPWGWLVVKNFGGEPIHSCMRRDDARRIYRASERVMAKRTEPQLKEAAETELRKNPNYGSFG